MDTHDLQVKGKGAFLRRSLSLLLAAALVLPLAPLARAAETTVPETTAETTVPETTAETTVPETTAETTVPETTAEATVPETTAETVPETTAATVPEETPVQQIQALIDALPEHVTGENREAVTEQLQEILTLFAALSEEEQEQVDIILCVLLQRELDAANVPQTLVTSGTEDNPAVVQASDTQWSGGFFKASGEVTLTERVEVVGDVTLILEAGSKLTASKGIQVSQGNSFTIKGSGELKATTSDLEAAGIGGNGSEGNSGTITIESGTVTATGGSNGAGIGGSFNTGTNGKAWIEASSIEDTSKQGTWSGVIFQGDQGQVYGNPTLTEDTAIPDGKTLTIPNGATLTVDAPLTNNGGTLTIQRGGTITGVGTITGNGTFQTYSLTEAMISVPTDLVYNGDDQSETIKGNLAISNTVVICGQGFQFDATGWVPTVAKKENSEREYTVTYIHGNDASTAVTKDVTLAKSGTQFVGDGAVKADKDEYIYGETVTVTANPTPTGVAAVSRLRAEPTTGQMALYLNGTHVSAAVEKVDGKYTMTVSVKDLIAAGAQYDQVTTLTAKFVGNDYMADAEGAVNVTLKPVTLTPSITGTTEKPYDGTTNTNSNLAITLEGKVGDDDVTATATGYAYDSADVGENKTITATGIILGGAAAGNYTLSSDKATTTGRITKSQPTIAFASGYNPSKTYDGQPIANPTADNLDITGAKFEDVVFTWTQNDTTATPKNAGTYTLTASIPDTSNTNPFSVELKDITISSRDIDNAEVVLGPTLIANGKKQTQTIKSVTVTVSVDGKNVTLPVTYDVTGDTGTAADGYKMTIKGTGNFTGEVPKDFVILPGSGSTDSKGNLVLGSGKITETVKPGSGAPVTGLGTSKAKVIEILTESGWLTENELIQVAEDGKTLNIVFETSDTVPDDDRDEIKALAKNNSRKVGLLFDISLYKQMGNSGNKIYLDETDDPIPMKVKVPDSLINTNKRYTRTYWIARCHDGEAEFLKTQFNSSSKMLSFETDRFSSYAIVYKDSRNPQTGDNRPIELWTAMLALSTVGLGAVVVVKRKKKK